MLYQGEQYDSDLGLYYLSARYYNPLTKHTESDAQGHTTTYSYDTAGNLKLVQGDLVGERRPMEKSDEANLYREVAARYREITAISDVPPREILRHRLSLVGSPCENCGKELKTPLAKKCVECGHVRESTVARS
jgi:hypothetical protein